MKLRIDEVVPKSDTCPVLVNFLNGSVTENFTTAKCYTFQDENTGKKTIATEIDKIVYYGEEEDDGLEQTFLVARNKKTGKVRLIEAGAVNIKPYFHREKPSELLDTSAIELSRKFGSKKSKQKMEHKERLKVDTKTVTEQMEKVTKTITAEKADLTAYLVENSDEFYVPPINKDAVEVHDVYDLDQILSPEQLEKVLSEIDGKDYASEYHPFIKDIVSDRTLDSKEIALGLYASALFNIYSMNSRDIAKKSFSISAISPTLNEIVLMNFCQQAPGKPRARPAMYRDKTICHAIVLCLLLNKFKLDLEMLATKMKISPTTVVAKARACLATVTVSGQKKVAVLKLPLPSNKAFRRKSAKF
ncbi:unnamed protein product [Plutella xylostella]|uniref:(diamondback moth) hypothetical protein n=1 Tax=Plutella xylostella TaxID=51655 RepID=A0A8S4GB66_PLUXY|nr:unnamed protein product [Plutella xylostella]